MFARYRSFSDYVKDYGLERSEGLLLRHRAQVWKVLSPTVPENTKTEEIIELEDYFRELNRSIDSSLLEEWERLNNPDFVAATSDTDKPARPASYDLTPDNAAFCRLVRTAIFGFLQDIAAREFDSALSRPRPKMDDRPRPQRHRRAERRGSHLHRRPHRLPHQKPRRHRLRGRRASRCPPPDTSAM